MPRIFREEDHPRGRGDKGGQFVSKGGGSGSALGDKNLVGNPNRDKKGPMKIADAYDVALKSLPEEARTEEGAQKVFRRAMRRLIDSGTEFYHESPGDVAASMRKEGIRSDYGVFMAIGEPSNFVTSETKTIVRFKIPPERAEELSPDMIYGRYAGDVNEDGTEQKVNVSYEQDFLIRHRFDVNGAYVTLPDAVPPKWITGIEVKRPRDEAPAEGTKTSEIYEATFEWSEQFKTFRPVVIDKSTGNEVYVGQGADSKEDAIGIASTQLQKFERAAHKSGKYDAMLAAVRKKAEETAPKKESGGSKDEAAFKDDNFDLFQKYPAMTTDEKRALLDYSGPDQSSGGFALNKKLREGEPLSAEEQKMKDDLMALAAKTTLPEDTKLHRVIGLFGKFGGEENTFSGLSPGDVITDEAFMSTSVHEIGGPEGSSQMIILAEKGSHVILGGAPEVVLPAGSSLEFVRKDKDKFVFKLVKT